MYLIDNLFVDSYYCRMLPDTIDKKIIGALEIEPLHPSGLSRITKLPRTTITYRLNRLAKQKAVRSKIRGRKIIWEINYRPQKNQLFQVYSDENFKDAYLECLKIKPNSIIFSVQGMSAASSELKHLPRSLVFKIHEYFKKHNIVFKSITNQKTLEVFKEIDNQYIKSHTGRAGGLKLFKNNLFLDDGEIAVCEQFVLATNPKNKTAVLIKDKAIIMTLYQTFSLLFDSLEQIRGLD